MGKATRRGVFCLHQPRERHCNNAGGGRPSLLQSQMVIGAARRLPRAGSRSCGCCSHCRRAMQCTPLATRHAMHAPAGAACPHPPPCNADMPFGRPRAMSMGQSTGPRHNPGGCTFSANVRHSERSSITCASTTRPQDCGSGSLRGRREQGRRGPGPSPAPGQGPGSRNPIIHAAISPCI